MDEMKCALDMQEPSRGMGFELMCVGFGGPGMHCKGGVRGLVVALTW